MSKMVAAKGKAAFVSAVPDDAILDCHDNMGQPIPLFEPQTIEECLGAGGKDSTTIPVLFTEGQRKSSLYHGKLINTIERFNKRFQHCTKGLFAEFGQNDWANIVVAGGSILHCLTPGSAEPSPNSDIDLFLYGMTESAARIKIDQLYQKFSATRCIGESGQSIVVLRTVHTLTLVCPYPIPHTQVILRLHSSKEEVISAFDVDCCGVMFDGQKVFVTKRCIRALNSHCNVATPERRSWTYESRLLKYVKRGYSIAVPGLRPSEVQLKKPFKKTCYRSQLDKEDPRFVPYGNKKAYEKIDLGWEWKFGEDHYGGYYGQSNEDEDMPSMFDYFQSKCLRKLLIANMAGRKIFAKEQKRSKFIMKSRSTMEIAMYMQSIGEHYGPSAPDVPCAHLYSVSEKGAGYFLSKKINEHGYINFQIGGIPTGTAEVGGTDDWDADCYIPLVLPDEAAKE